MRTSILACLLVPAVACTSLDPHLVLEPPVTAPDLRGASLRGLSVPHPGLAWVSGSAGDLARTVDGGATWTRLEVPGTEELDLRMLVAFDAYTAWVGSAGPGDESRLWRTTDGGASWDQALANDDPQGFWDGLAFWDRSHGILVGDPTVDPATGRRCMTVFVTEDGGDSWSRVPADALPAPARTTDAEGELLDEYCFAASNRSIALGAPGQAWIGTGGAAARVLRTLDGGRSWTVAETPLGQVHGAAGVFAVAAAPGGHVLQAVGGRYDLPDGATLTASWSSDGGRSWSAAERPPAGYRSAVAFLPPTWRIDHEPAPLAVAAGTSGVSLAGPGPSGSMGAWREAGGLAGANGLAFEPDGGTLWAVGPGLAIWKARLVTPREVERDEGGALFTGE